MQAIQILLIEIGVILLLARLLGAAMRVIHQPQVVGEMIAGIILGPSLLGLFHHGAWMEALFPTAMRGYLNVLAQLGVMLFMFLIGLELDPKLLRGQGKAALVTGSIGIVIPFALGATLALGLVANAPKIAFPPAIAQEVRSPLVLCLFIGAAMSITAFPVLARILTERNLHKTKSGVLALTCAAMDDVMGWCILAFVIAVAHLKGYGDADGGHGGALFTALRTVGLSVAFVCIMIFVVRRLLARLQAHFEARGYLSQNVLAIVFLLLIASSLATDFIGIHQIFGAFMFGAVMPKSGRFIKHLSEKVEDFTVLFLLPLFFAYTGLNTELGKLDSPMLWLICAGIILTATAGKFGGVTLAGRFYGMSWRQGSLLGVLMNTRGLMELIILNIGYSFGVLSKELFAMMVLMALATTFMTTPLMRLLYSPARQKKELEEAAREEAERHLGLNVVVPVSYTNTAAALVRMGGMLIAGDKGRLYALHLDRPEEIRRPGREVMTGADEVLGVAQRAAQEKKVPISAVSFVSRNIGADISNAAKRYQASWIVMGWHKPVFFKSALGLTVTHVLRNAPANLAIFIDKGLGELQTIVVPYLGQQRDRDALLAAERLARLPGVRVTILHVVKPNRDAADPAPDIEAAVEEELLAASSLSNVQVRVVENESPLDVVAEQSARFDLMILGLNDEWNLRAAPLFGRPETVTQRAKCSLLIVHASPQAPTPSPEPEARQIEAGAHVAPA